MAESTNNGTICFRPLTLTVAIATFGPDGGRRVAAMKLPRVAGVDYLVSWQTGEPDADADRFDIPPELAAREDVRVMMLAGRGISRNRNNLLDHARGDIFLFADDDLQYYPEAFAGVIRAFETHPDMEIALFRYDSELPKAYPEGEIPLGRRRLPKNYFPTSVEIALRRDSRAGQLRLNEEFGLGAERFTAGEESLMMLQARRRGFNIRFIPLTLCFHPGPTTGVRPRLAPGAILSNGVIMAMEYPLTAVLRALIVSCRISRAGQASFLRALRLLLSGIFYGFHHRRQLL